MKALTLWPRFIGWARSKGEALTALRAPDFIIGGHNRPYLLRWWLIPRNPVFNVYLHQFRRDDDDRALHDHPWCSLSIILAGGYWEHLPGDIRLWRPPGSVVARRARQAHRVSLEPNNPAMTLFITGPRVRTWGFHCPQGWIPWKLFVGEDTGTVGKGCAQ